MAMTACISFRDNTVSGKLREGKVKRREHGTYLNVILSISFACWKHQDQSDCKDADNSVLRIRFGVMGGEYESLGRQQVG